MGAYMTDEDARREARRKYNREINYRLGRRTEGWPANRTKKSVRDAIARQAAFKAQYPNPEKTLDEWQEAGIIKDMTERLAMELCYGVNGQIPPSLSEIGEQLRLSKQRVHQIVKAVLARRDAVGGE